MVHLESMPLASDMVEALPEVAIEALSDRVHIDTFMPEHGVPYGQFVTSTEVQQQNTAWVHVRGAILPDHSPPGNNILTMVFLYV